jgi:hypothetical protein
MSKKEVKFIFDNEASAQHFLKWLCGSGEQDYWQWMECRESQESGNITVKNFDYWSGNVDAGFGNSDIICKSGRLTKDFNDD